MRSVSVGAGVCVCSSARPGLNWKKAVDKGALCGTGAALIHAEGLVSRVGALRRGRNLLESPPAPSVPQHLVACCAAGARGPRGAAGRAARAAQPLRGRVVTVPRGQEQTRRFSPSAWQLSRCLPWHNEVCGWGGRDSGLMGGDTKRQEFNH